MYIIECSYLYKDSYKKNKSKKRQTKKRTIRGSKKKKSPIAGSIKIFFL